MFYYLNSWSDSEVRVRRRDRLPPEGHQGHGTKDFRWDITTSVRGRRGEPGTRGWGLLWDYLAHLPGTPQTGRTRGLLSSLKAEKCDPSGPPFTDGPVHHPDALHERGVTRARGIPTQGCGLCWGRAELSREFAQS